jgi:phytol kinase
MQKEAKPDQKKFEWNRQFFHIILGIAIVALVMYGLLDQLIILVIIMLGLALSYACKRMRVPVISRLLEKFERKEELKKFPGKGTLFYFIGVFVSLVLFPGEIAMASIMVLALGDSISHIYGINYGKLKTPLSRTKFLEGTIAGILFGFIGALVFLPWHEALIASFFGMVVEAVEVKIGGQQFDDNLLIPIASGAAVLLWRLLV